MGSQVAFPHCGQCCSEYLHAYSCPLMDLCVNFPGIDIQEENCRATGPISQGSCLSRNQGSLKRSDWKGFKKGNFTDVGTEIRDGEAPSGGQQRSGERELWGALGESDWSVAFRRGTQWLVRQGRQGQSWEWIPLHLSPPTLPAPAGATHWLSPARSLRTRELIEVIHRCQPPGVESRPKKGGHDSAGADSPQSMHLLS